MLTMEMIFFFSFRSGHDNESSETDSDVESDDEEYKSETKSDETLDVSGDLSKLKISEDDEEVEITCRGKQEKNLGHNSTPYDVGLLFFTCPCRALIH